VNVEVSAPKDATITVVMPPGGALCVINAVRRPSADAKRVMDPDVGLAWLVGDWSDAELRWALNAKDDETEDSDPRIILVRSGK